MLFSCLKPEHGQKHGAMDPVPEVQEMGSPLLETAAPLSSAQVISAFKGKKKLNLFLKRVSKCDNLKMFRAKLSFNLI